MMEHTYCDKTRGSGSRNIASNFSIESILGASQNEKTDINETQLNYMDISDDYDDEIDINEDTDNESNVGNTNDASFLSCTNDQSQIISTSYAPILPRPSPSLLLKSNFFSLSDPLQFPPHQVSQIESDPSNNNLIFSQWLSTASKPPPLFFGLQGLKYHEIKKISLNGSEVAMGDNFLKNTYHSSSLTRGYKFSS